MPPDPLWELLVITFVGWPAIITSLVLALCGLIFKKWILLVISGVVALPFSVLYMGGYLNSYFIGASLTLGHFGAAFSVAKKRMVIAWVLLLPFTALAILLAYAVLTQAH
jgi:hypothetical protein